MVDQGLKIDELPHELKEAVYTISDLSDNFEDLDDKGAIDLADLLLSKKANEIQLIEALPDNATIKKEHYISIDRDALSLEQETAALIKEAAKFERNMQKRIKAAKTIEEIDALREEIDDENRFEDLDEDPKGDLLDDLTDREATIRASLKKEETPAPAPILRPATTTQKKETIEKKPDATEVAKKRVQKWLHAKDLRLEKNKAGEYPRRFERDGKTYVRHLFYTNIFCVCLN